ncbi:hypothetical protein BN946_scf184799.g60 [Trametes cinnabarina]|uniref:Uncharacterized protein n=1 Tax=Pycnoporus cinnabarinus TaxID=5643 RepID=A0A060S7I9_PYCCI|nr:hypothetical protein BN946_scf184799.g60 [Trametes cinnabarina]
MSAQSSPKAYTPKSSPTPDGHGDITEQSPIPAKLEFVAPDDADAAGGSSFILSTRAALDAIMALPTRLYPAPVHVAGDIDELLEEPSVDPAKGTLRLGAGLSIAISDSLDASLCSIEPVSELDCRLADGEDFPVRFDNTPRGRGRTQVPPISNADWSRTGTSAAVRARIATAFVEEVSKDQNAVAGTSETIGRPGVLQRRPRPKNPPVTVWPRIPLETQRQRMPSVQPANNSEWDGPRRSRTISGA